MYAAPPRWNSETRSQAPSNRSLRIACRRHLASWIFTVLAETTRSPVAVSKPAVSGSSPAHFAALNQPPSHTALTGVSCACHYEPPTGCMQQLFEQCDPGGRRSASPIRGPSQLLREWRMEAHPSNQDVRSSRPGPRVGPRSACRGCQQTQDASRLRSLGSIYVKCQPETNVGPVPALQ